MSRILVILTALVSVCHAGNEIDLTGIIAFVNEEAVTRDEAMFFFEYHRSAVYQHFHRVHGVTDFDGFWDQKTRFGEDSPLGMLKELAIQDIIDVRIQLDLARDEGLISDTSFSAVMQLRKEENDRRAKAIQSGRVLYGPREYSEAVFFDYLISNLVIRLKERLIEKDYERIVSRKISQAEVRLLPAYELMQVE